MSDETCGTCGRPVWDGGHALNENECDERGGEVCRLHARLRVVEALLEESERQSAIGTPWGEKGLRERLRAAVVAKDPRQGQDPRRDDHDGSR